MREILAPPVSQMSPSLLSHLTAQLAYICHPFSLGVASVLHSQPALSLGEPQNEVKVNILKMVV